MPASATIDTLYLIGKSDPMQQLFKMIGRICNADCAVLLIGEKGSGKQMVARAIHFFSHRSGFPFNTIRGSDLRDFSDEQLLGIDQTHPAEATCYITEFTDIPAIVHDQLLSIHRRKEYRCAHNNDMRKHNLRFIVENNGTIKEDMETGRFAVDLYYDWNFLPLYIPPLRDHKEDIPFLASHFVELHATGMRISKKEFSPEAMEILMVHDWPGNIDELKEVLRLALGVCKGHYIRAEHLPDLKDQRKEGSESLERLELFLSSKLSSYIDNSSLDFDGNLYRLLLPEMEKSLFDYTINKCKGNKNKAAQLLGLHRNTLNKKLQRV